MNTSAFSSVEDEQKAGCRTTLQTHAGLDGGIAVRTEKRRVFLVLILFFLAVQGLVWSADKTASPSGLAFVREFEGGRLYQAGRLDVLALRGTFRQMGRQEGGLQKETLRKFYDAAISERFIGRQGLRIEVLERVAQHKFELYPQRFKEVVYGMAETSGMSQRDLALLNHVWNFAYMSPPAAQCSAIALWGDYAGGGSLTIGRNLDYFGYFKEFAEHLRLVVYNPDDGIPTASFGYAGQVGTNNGINKAGVFLSVNDGSQSGGKMFYPDRTPTGIRNLEMLLDCSSLAGIDAVMQSARMDWAMILCAADADSAVCYEAATFDMRRRSADAAGLLVATNHFVDASWGMSAPPRDSATQTLRRRANLLGLAQQDKGKFDPQKVMALLDIPLDQGGATPAARTVFQMVAAPKELGLWLKVPDYQDWVSIDLGKLFVDRSSGGR